MKILGCFDENTGRTKGKNLGLITNVMSAYDCQLKCQETNECEYFVYKESHKECVLTSIGAEPKSDKVGLTFGPKYC